MSIRYDVYFNMDLVKKSAMNMLSLGDFNTKDEVENFYFCSLPYLSSNLFISSSPR